MQEEVSNFEYSMDVGNSTVLGLNKEFEVNSKNEGANPKDLENVIILQFFFLFVLTRQAEGISMANTQRLLCDPYERIYLLYF